MVDKFIIPVKGIYDTRTESNSFEITLCTFQIQGVNGLVEFQSETAKRDWKIMSVQHFEVTSDPSAVDVNANLELIKSIGNIITSANLYVEQSLHTRWKNLTKGS